MDVNGNLANTKPYVLVTGGAGFIGSHTVVELLENGLRVVVLDNLSNAAGSKHKLPPSLDRVQQIVPTCYRDNLCFENGSYGDVKKLNHVFESFNINSVIHLGGYKAVGESKQFPMMYYNNNVVGTLNLLKVMAKYHVKKLLYSSSATVYTEVKPEKLPFSEDSVLGDCTCAYAKTKFFTEMILKDLALSDNEWKIISLRYFNPVGAHPTGLIGEDPRGIPANLMPFIAQVAIGRRTCLNVFGDDYPTPDGTGVRDYIHVCDVAKGHMCALKSLSKIKLFRAYNLGTGKGTSVLEMVEIFKRVTGQDIPVQIKERRPGDVPAMYCNPNRACNELNWKAERSVEQMCADLWRFQQNNPKGYLTTES